MCFVGAHLTPHHLQQYTKGKGGGVVGNESLNWSYLNNLSLGCIYDTYPYGKKKLTHTKECFPMLFLSRWCIIQKLHECPYIVS